MAKIYRQTVRPVNKRSGKLVWLINGREVVIKDNTEWHVLQNLKTKLKNDPQYRKGELKIQYNFTKNKEK